MSLCEFDISFLFVWKKGSDSERRGGMNEELSRKTESAYVFVSWDFDFLSLFFLGSYCSLSCWWSETPSLAS